MEAVDTLQALSAGGASLAELLALSPKILEQLVDHALAQARFGKHEEAEGLLTQLALVDSAPVLPFLLATIRAARTNYQGAIEACSECLRRDEAQSVDPQLRPEALLLRAQCLLHADALDDARADLEAAKASEVAHVVCLAEAALSAMGEPS